MTLQEQIDKYIRSPEFEKAKIDLLRKRIGVKMRKVDFLAEYMRDILVDVINNSPMPRYGLDHGDHLKETLAEIASSMRWDIVEGSEPGELIIKMWFDEQQNARESLYDADGYYKGLYDGHTGPGVDNIMALYNNGTQKQYMVIGSNLPLTGHRNKKIKITGPQEFMGFMGEAVQAFNESEVAVKLHATAEMSDDYD